MLEGKFNAEYQKKLVTADQAAALVKSGDVMIWGEFAMQPAEFDAALAKRKSELKGVRIDTDCLTFIPETAKADPTGESFILNDFYFSGISRMLGDRGLVYHIPPMYHQVPEIFRKGLRPKLDHSVIKVAPMDERGFFNFGPVSSLHANLREFSKNIIVEVNSSVPTCLGGPIPGIHISDVDYIIESVNNLPLAEIPELVATEADRKIAELLMEQMVDGACLQFGIGGLPNYIAKEIARSDLRDLGMHSEMLVDACVDMYEAGVLTGKRKQIDKNQMVYTFGLGSSKLYNFLDNNPACAMYPCEYTNDPFIIAQNDNVFAVCNCLEVDLYGQVSSESYGPRQISGTGGSLDFMLGAFRSKGGKGFMCLNSTVTQKDGTLTSRIVPGFDQFTVVTCPRTITFYVATEYGITSMKGKPTWQRAEDLINIAHPDFRDGLIKAAEQNKIWLHHNKRC